MDLESRAEGAPKRAPLFASFRGCAGRDICPARSRLTSRAPPQLPGRCHPPRSGCRLSLQARASFRVLAHREAGRDPSAGRLRAVTTGLAFSPLRP